MKILYEKKYKIKTLLRPNFPREGLNELPGDTVKISIAFDNDDDDIQLYDSPAVEVFCGPLTSIEEDWDKRCFLLDDNDVDLIKRHAKQFLEGKARCSSPEKVHVSTLESIFWIGQDYDHNCVINRVDACGYRELCLTLDPADLEKFVKALDDGIKAFKRLQKKAKNR